LTITLQQEIRMTRLTKEVRKFRKSIENQIAPTHLIEEYAFLCGVRAALNHYDEFNTEEIKKEVSDRLSVIGPEH
jgi:hypothetical protein